MSPQQILTVVMRNGTNDWTRGVSGSAVNSTPNTVSDLTKYISCRRIGRIIAIPEDGWLLGIK